MVLSLVNDYSYEEGYVSIEDKKVVVESIENYQPNEEAFVYFANKAVDLKNGEIVLDTELTADQTTQRLFIYEEGALKIVKLLVVDKAISTARGVYHVCKNDFLRFCFNFFDQFVKHILSPYLYLFEQ